MKFTINLDEIPLKPKQVGLKEKSKRTFAANNCSIFLANSGFTIYTPDWGVTYEVNINKRGKATVKKVGEERCFR